MRKKGSILTLLAAVCCLIMSSCIQQPRRTPGVLVPVGESKIDELIYLLRNAYVDSINADSITEIAMMEMVKALDPHSAYIPAEDLEDVNNELSGSFSGIGIQFSIQQDTVRVVAVISGGPSEHIGVLAGDKIVEVNDSALVGSTITNEKVIHQLRGPKGTEVTIGVLRSGTDEMLHYTITRGDIPVHSVDAAFIVDGTKIGFVSVNKFGDNTYNEFLQALASLRAKGAQQYIVDLRQNSGGYMDQAIRMANEFLDRGALIVYAEGRAYPRYEASATGNGRFKTEPLVVLVDEFSASASEIFTGAMKDNNRATVIGRRTFGKGLVQQQMPFPDGSAIRLTVARYYTPSGRCVQKPYEMGKKEEYYMDTTSQGGIMPDMEVSRDTSEYSPYAIRVINHAYTYQFAYQYVDQHRSELKKYTDWRTLEQHLIDVDVMPEFIRFCQMKNIEPNEADLAKSGALLRRLVHAYIVRDLLGDEGFFPLFERDDVITKAAVEFLTRS